MWGHQRCRNTLAIDHVRSRRAEADPNLQWAIHAIATSRDWQLHLFCLQQLHIDPLQQFISIPRNPFFPSGRPLHYIQPHLHLSDLQPTATSTILDRVCKGRFISMYLLKTTSNRLFSIQKHNRAFHKPDHKRICPFFLNKRPSEFTSSVARFFPRNHNQKTRGRRKHLK